MFYRISQISSSTHIKCYESRGLTLNHIYTKKITLIKKILHLSPLKPSTNAQKSGGIRHFDHLLRGGFVYANMYSMVCERLPEEIGAALEAVENHTIRRRDPQKSRAQQTESRETCFGRYLKDQRCRKT